MKTKPKFKVGDKVRLNDEGLNIIFGHTVGLKHMKTKVCVVTWIAEESITSPEKVYEMSIDAAELNKFWINDDCFDLVEDNL